MESELDGVRADQLVKPEPPAAGSTQQVLVGEAVQDRACVVRRGAEQVGCGREAELGA